MCRWLAYSGTPIFLSRLLFEPENSLIDQSLHARESISTTNGDGFGIGWYDARPHPGVFRDVLPAWNDENLHALSEQIRSGLFLAHVRASTGTSTARQNCHPFRHGPWLFMHNGQIGGYGAIRRHLEMLIDPSLYRHRTGTTDSEAMFYLALSLGLDGDAMGALARMVGQVENLMADAGETAPLRISLVVSDGGRLIALRYSSDRRSPSMYLGLGGPALAEAGLNGAADGQDILVLSEPLDDVGGNWRKVSEGNILVAERGVVETRPFTPAR
jgi:glutamine amidotransferase